MARVFSVFREVGGQYEVSEPEAYAVATSAAAILTRRLGMVGMTSVRTFSWPFEDNPIDLAQLGIRESGLHNVLMTGRLSPAPGELHGNRQGTTHLVRDESSGAVISSSTMISIAPVTEESHAAVIARTVHRLTHTFGVQHCIEEACIMQPSAVMSHEYLETIARADNPYCFEHNTELGRIAAHAQLDMYE